MGCGKSCYNLLLTVINLLCLLSGIALLVVGVLISNQFKFVNVLHGSWLTNIVAAAFVIIGLALIVTSLTGFCGVVFQSKIVITIYSVLLFLLITIQVVAGVVAITNRHEMQQLSDQSINELWKDRRQNLKFWDTIQQTFHCCGLNSATDWNPNSPKSCCIPGVSECIALVNAYNIGCSREIKNTIDHTIIGFFSTLIALVGIELIGLIFAGCLHSYIHKNIKKIGY